MVDQTKSYRQTVGLNRGQDFEQDDSDREDGGDAERCAPIRQRERRPQIVAPSCGTPLDDNQPLRGSVKIDFPVHPQAVAMGTVGDCLNPVVSEGDVVVAEPVLPKPGDLAVIWPTVGNPVIKYLVSSLDYCFPHNPRSEVILNIRLRMLNPPSMLSVRADHVERIWRIAKVIPAGDVVRLP